MKMTKRISTLLIVLMLSVIMVPVAVSANAFITDTQVNYVALGDSLGGRDHAYLRIRSGVPGVYGKRNRCTRGKIRVWAR
ncbi:hypothetical protein MFMK1_001336 [Metallumcola ferriviriculae]|uniref:Uncharacterized protein n=1 Tax=Metallumcola ferriviriculae TaxID=3039180 RepID=A0AAU0UMS7_9FIRM|nr:hypothetical protein MFMK1_001336 [Desulfitibacteraceae bacterium MK1]